MAIVHNSIMSKSERAQWVIINITAYDEDIRKTKNTIKYTHAAESKNKYNYMQMATSVELEKRRR